MNPYSFGREGSRSPEGQAFVVEMYAAWRDWVALGAQGANAAARAHAAVDLACFAAVGVALVLLYAA